MIRFAVIDRHPIFRLGISVLLKDNFSRIEVTSSLDSEALKENYLPYPPDIIIMGFSHEMRISDTNELIKIKREYPSAKVVICKELRSSEQNECSSYHGISECYIKMGADILLPKEHCTIELIDCIHNLLRGKSCREDERQAARQQLETTTFLTHRELEIAVYLAQGLSSNTIAEKLKRTPSTISTTKTNIYRKLNITNILALRSELRLD